MYCVTIYKENGDYEQHLCGNRREAFLLRNRAVRKASAVWADVFDAITGEAWGFGVPPETRLLHAIFNEPLPKPAFFYRSFETNGWEVSI